MPNAVKQIIGIYFLCIFGTVFLGVEAAFIMCVKWASWEDNIFGVVSIIRRAGFVALFIAHLLFPILILCNINRRRYARNVFITFVIASATTGIYTWNYVYGPLTIGGSILVAIVSVLIVNVFVGLIDRGHKPPSEYCPECGYPLYGLRQKRCPECGWGRDE